MVGAEGSKHKEEILQWESLGRPVNAVNSLHYFTSQEDVQGLERKTVHVNMHNGVNHAI